MSLPSKKNNPPEELKYINDAKGLFIEESLLFEKNSGDVCGVDLEACQNLPSKTGLPLRQSVGIPSLSEPEVIRHFVRLSQQNYSIDQGIYPLGSCTMKHNPRCNEKIARLSGLSSLHPLQPEHTIQGALRIMYELQQWLSALSGLPAVTLNPAAGAHGEMAGIMVIKKRHLAKGRERKVILIPDSAHGTNPATATMCGYHTQTIPSTKDGVINLEAFKAALHDDVAALMLTNPNTCGIFENKVQEIAHYIHQIGGYFYCDGANFNAIVGKVSPARCGVDVMHFNLHKTFSTPHGGGGPGCGPIAVSKELSPYLPIPYIIKKEEQYHLITQDEDSIGRIKSFHGHFGMFVRALAYMYSHGKDGLKQVAEDAVLNANYIFSQLKADFHTPFSQNCMHECLLSDKFQKQYGITTLDISKALMEFGIHPMTMYFPLVVQGAMLIEPTETETKHSLDRFIAVMKHIAQLARDGQAATIKSYPHSTPRGRVDEVKAAKELSVRWQKKDMI